MAETIKGINVVLGAETTGLAKALEDVNKKSKAIQSELKQVEKLLKLDPQNTELLAQKQKLLSDAIANTREKLERLRAVQEQVNEQFQRGEISEGQYRAFQREVVKTEQELKKLEERLKSMEPAVKSLGERMQEAGEKMKKAGERMTDIGKNLSTKVTAPLAGLGAVVAKTGMDFEAAMSEVAAISGATGDDLVALTEKAKEMGATTKFSASEAAEALKYMAMAGWDTEKMLAGLPGVMSLAAASGEDLATVSDIVTDAMTAFGLEAADAARFADILAAASSNANTNVGMMGETFKYVAPVFGSLGYTAEDAALAIGLMANAGIKASQAGTALRGAVSRMVKPTGDAAKLMEQLGIKLTDTQGNMLPFRDVMDQLRASFSKLTAEQQAQYASIIFGQEAMSGMLAIINASEEDYQKLAAAIDNSTGAADRMAKQMQDNLKGRLTELKSALEGVALQLFDHLQPALEKIVDALKKVVDWFANLSPGVQQTIIIIAGLVAAIGPLLLIFGPLISAIGTLITGLGAMSTAMAGGATLVSALSAGFPALGAAITLITGPIGIAIAAIAALTAGGIALYNHLSKEAIPEVQRFGDEVSESTQKAVGAFLDLNDQATVALNQLSWSGQTVTQEMANNITSIFDQMGDQVLTAMQEDHAQQLQSMQEFFAQSSSLTEQEETAALEKMKQHQQSQQQVITEGQKRIAEILQKAADEKRALTEKEKQEINRIQQEMVNTGIQVLSESELEQKAILERMKANASTLSAQQAAEVVRNSKKQKDEAIKAANEQYNNVVKEIIRQRDEVGSITKEQADKLIQEATRQRDEAVKKATDMHNKVVEEAKKQAEEHVDKVNWETGEVLTKWETFKNSLTRKWDKIKTKAASVWESAKKAITKPIEEAKETILDIIEKIKSAFANMKITIPKPKLPHITVNVQYKTIAGAKIPYPDFDLRWYAQGGIFTRPSIIGVGEAGKEAVIPLDKLPGLISDALRQALPATPSVSGGNIVVEQMIVRNDSDIQKIARELFTLQQRAARAKGVLA